MRPLEDRLEELYGYGFPSSTREGPAAVAALRFAGVLSADRAAVWRERLQRARGSRDPVDADLRARCLAYLADLSRHDSGADPAGALPYHFGEAGLITRADLVEPGRGEAPDPLPLPVPLGVALGPAPVDGGVHVIWIATYERWIELALREAYLDRFDAGEVRLRDAAGTSYEPYGHAFGNGRGQMRFAPCPAVTAVELVIGRETIALPVSHR